MDQSYLPVSDRITYCAHWKDDILSKNQNELKRRLAFVEEEIALRTRQWIEVHVPHGFKITKVIAENPSGVVLNLQIICSLPRGSNPLDGGPK